MAKRINYLSNKELIPEIWKSKLSYCDIFDGEASKALRRGLIAPDLNVDVITDDLVTVTQPGLTVRLNTDQHIPKAAEVGKGKLGHLEGDLSFEPFILYRSEIGHNSGSVTFREIARSHHRKGEFAPACGNLTGQLGYQISLLVERNGLKGNWRGYSYIDEMKGEATVNLVRNALKFNEAKSDNPFAYFSTLCNNSFLRVLNAESKQRIIRDDMLEDQGATPSSTRLMEQMTYSQGPAPKR